MSTAPVVQGWAVNDGASQRSAVGGFTVTFDQAVTLAPASIELVGRGGAAGLASILNPSGDGRTYVCTVVGGALPDGVYDLTVRSAGVQAVSGGLSMAADFAACFHRLFSDADGDGDSDNADLFQMRATYGKFTGDPGFNPSFDYDSDGDVDNADVFQVRSRRTTVYSNYGPAVPSPYDFVVGPGGSIAASLQSAHSGDEVFVRNGTYHETAAMIVPAGVRLLGQSQAGVVIDGTGLRKVVELRTGATLQSLTVRNAATRIWEAAVHVASGGRLQDVTVEDSDAVGIEIRGNDINLLRVTAQRNGQQGIKGIFSTQVRVTDSVTRDNNTGKVNPAWKDQTIVDGVQAAVLDTDGLWRVNPDWEAGGGKWWSCSDVIFDNYDASGNVGPGLWFDNDSTNVTIRNCDVRNGRYRPGTSMTWQAAGIRIELQSAAHGPFLVENCTGSGNAGGDVTIENASHVTVRNNQFLSSISVLLRNYNRGSSYWSTDVHITNNTLRAIVKWEQEQPTLYTATGNIFV